MPASLGFWSVIGAKKSDTLAAWLPTHSYQLATAVQTYCSWQNVGIMVMAFKSEQRGCAQVAC